ncbi:MAG: tetratricopeptide repeat protein, partial [Gemmatimonadetes bacterium]|nr:tetratricopeptide repeat protein [Gemmatimonadota bacterium]
LAETTDLPLDELLTESESAYRSYVDAFRALAVDADYGAALERVGDAVAIDSSFALAHWLRYAVGTFSGQSAIAVEALNAAKEHEYRLPERERLYVTREYHYTVRRDPAKGVAMAKRSVEMFPDDVEALAVLGLYYQVANEIDEAIGVYEQMLEIDPSQTQPLLAIGQLLSGRGRHDEAIEYLGRYAELSPDDMNAYPPLSAAYQAIGDFDLAAEACDRALLIDPEDVPAQICLGTVAYEQGRWSDAEAFFDDAFESSRTLAAIRQVHQARGAYFARRGQVDAALEERAREIDAMSASGAAPIEVALRRIRTLVLFVWAGREQAALDSIAAIETVFPPPFDNLGATGALDIYSILRDAEALASAADRVEQAIEALGAEALRPNVLMARGLVLELAGDCETALTNYRAALELAPTADAIRIDIGRCLVTLGRLDEAADELAGALERAPFGPRTLTQMARVEIERGNAEAARAHLERALDVWSDADRSYELASEARDLLASLPNG